MFKEEDLVTVLRDTPVGVIANINYKGMKGMIIETAYSDEFCPDSVRVALENGKSWWFSINDVELRVEKADQDISW